VLLCETVVTVMGGVEISHYMVVNVKGVIEVWHDSKVLQVLQLTVL
jgi:hypothetical protein